MKIQVHNAKGEVIDNLELDETVFGVSVDPTLVHQVLVGQLANQRSGTASTKTRGQVSGSGRKLYPQKHTGRARAGSRRSPTRRGGGKAFGPHPRSYRQDTPKKMRRLALKGTLSAKVSGGEFIVVDDFAIAEPKTKAMVHLLGALGVDSSALVVPAEADIKVTKSTQNLEGVKTLPARSLNVVDLLSYKTLIMNVPAVRKVEELWGSKSRLRGKDAPA